MASLLWTQRQDIGPSARFVHALVFDERRERTLLFGGESVGVLHGDTWSWDGETWTQVQDVGPSARSVHALSFDSARDRVVLFGGKAGSMLSDTWEWDGEAWTQVQDTGPAARGSHAIAFDSARSRTVLFGGTGEDGSPLADTWEWDGSDWTQVADTGPGARHAHAICFDAARSRTVLVGGSDLVADTWAWDGNVWTQITDVGPPPGRHAALVSTGSRVFLFGGIDLTPDTPAQLSGLTWELEGDQWTERQDMGPSARFGHDLAYDRKRQRVVLFGGLTSFTPTTDALRSDTWELPVEAGAGQPGMPPGLVMPTSSGGMTTSGDGMTVSNVVVDPPRPRLVGFTIEPPVAGAGEFFTMRLTIDRPAATDTLVTLALEALDFASPTPDQVPVMAGQTTWVASLPAEALPIGIARYRATLDDVSLIAPYDRQS